MTDPTQPPAPGFGRLARSSVVFVLGAVVGKAAGLLLLPFLTRMLTPAGLGQADVLLSLGSALTATLTLGLDIAILRLWFDHPDTDARRTLASTGFLLVLGAAAAAGLVILAGADAIKGALFGAADLRLAILALPVIVAAGAVVTIAQTVLRAEGRAGAYAVLNGGVAMAYAGLAVVLLSTWRADGNAVLSAWAIALVAFALCGALLVRGAAFGRPSTGAARSMLRLGLPLAPAVAAILIGESVNRMILLELAGAEEVAYYSVAARFAAISLLAVGGFQLAWQPRAFAMGVAVDARQRIATDARWITGIIAAMVLGVAVIAPDVLPLVTGPGYVDALPVLGFSLLASLGAGLYLVASLPSAIAKRTEDLAFASAISVIAAIAANVVLVELWQSVGTAAAIALGQVVAVVVVARLGRRRLELPFEWPKLAAMTGLTSAVTVAILAGGLELPVRLALAAFAVLVLVQLVGWRGGLEWLRARLRARRLQDVPR